MIGTKSRVLVMASMLAACGNGNVVSDPAKVATAPMGSSRTSAASGAPPPAPTRHAMPPGAQVNATFATTVAREMTRADARLDGARITALRANGSCAASIVTATGTIAVNWSTIGDLAPTDDGRTMTLPLSVAGQSRELVMRSGEEAERVLSSLGLLATECQGK
jgi:hypothetical protein